MSDFTQIDVDDEDMDVLVDIEMELMQIQGFHSQP